MITHEQNEYLCRTGPGTPMGELFRRYWIPALMAEELPRPNCPPVQVQLLGERLVAFRDTQGRLGLMDEFCAHRGVSLWFGRNEENGLRCPYHGWKYDVTGQCVDVPSEPASSGFCQKITLKSYPCVELGGVIWAYMGPPAEMPPLPAFEWVHLKCSQVFLSKRHAANGHAWVPMDDHNCMAWTMTFHPARDLSEREIELMKTGAGVHAELVPGTLRPVANRTNGYLMDRAAQEAGHYYSGVKGLAIQDASVQESMGPITDRSKENLVSTDNAIIMARLRLRKAAQAVQKGERAPGLDAEAQSVRSASFVLSEDAAFKEAAFDAVKVRKGEHHVAV